MKGKGRARGKLFHLHKLNRSILWDRKCQGPPLPGPGHLRFMHFVQEAPAKVRHGLIFNENDVTQNFLACLVPHLTQYN